MELVKKIGKKGEIVIPAEIRKKFIVFPLTKAFKAS